MKKILFSMALSVVGVFCVSAQNYSTVQVTLQDGVLVVNGIEQMSVPNYDPSEVQLEPIVGSVAVPSADQMYTIAEYPTLDAVWTACQSSATWSTNLVTLDTYSGTTANTGFAALKFSGSPNTYGYAAFDKTVSGAWTEFGYFTSGSGIDESVLCLSMSPNPASDVLTFDGAEGAQISVCTLNGQEVMNIAKATGHDEISVSDLASGVYVVRFVFDNKVIVKKFVKE